MLGKYKIKTKCLKHIDLIFGMKYNCIKERLLIS